MFNFIYSNVDFAHKIDDAYSRKDDYDRHMHYFNEIVYFVSGNVEYTVEAETHRLKEGDIIVIQPGKYHNAKILDNETPYERYVLKFPDEILPDYLREKKAAQDTFFFDKKKFALNLQLLDSYYGNYSDEDTKTLFIGETIKLIIMLCKESSERQIKKNDFITNIINYIDENIRQTITLDTLNKEFNFSKSYISNEFKRHIHIPIMQYVRAKKIIAAHPFILGKEKKSVVAEMFGFENYSTFYRSYIKVMGFPPNSKSEAAEEKKKNEPEA